MLAGVRVAPGIRWGSALLAGFAGAGPCGEVTASAVSTGPETITTVATFAG